MRRPTPRLRSSRVPLAPRLAAAALVALGFAAGAGPVAGDWLVTRAGERIETEGPWEVRGKLVVFHRPGGALASIRADEIDLEASREASTATPAAVEPPPPAPAPPAPPREAVLVLTDADVAHVARAAAPGEAAEEPPGDAETAPEPRLAVVSWDEAAGDEGVAVVGRVQNASAETLTAATVSVALLDADGQLLATGGARLTATTLPPGGTANFRAEFPSVWAFFDARFETDAFALASRDVDEAPEASVPSDDG